MFRKSNPSPQIHLFTASSSLFRGKSLSIYQDANAWHNQFREQVTMQIDEKIFEPLYSSTQGTPNASIRVLIAMMVLKEAEGLSDQKLFESCRFNMLTRSAIGLVNADDAVPTDSTYYLFRKKVYEHTEAGNATLFDVVFSSITKKQCLEFDVSGKRIRMDSKLLGSNIAWLSRYELVHQTFRLFYKQIKKEQKFDTVTKQKLEALLKYTGNKVVYTSTTSELKTKFQELGCLISEVLPLFCSSKNECYKTLKRVFVEQFKVGCDKVVVSRDTEEISAKSVQSPHDTDCHFRNKDGNKVKGYTINVTESCDDDKGLNLIGNVDVRAVSVSDVDFFQDGVNSVEEVFLNKAEDIHTDGAYHSPDNQEFCSKNDANLHLHAIQGAKSRYLLELSQNHELTVLDTQTNISLEVTKIKGKNNVEKWRIKTEKGYRYFTQKAIDCAVIRKKIAQTPKEILQKRNNVEATIFQLGYHYSNAKSRYRGLVKHQMWANIRCLWVNFVRILNFVQKTGVKTSFFRKYIGKHFFDKLILACRTFLQQEKNDNLAFLKNLKFNAI
jgi:hypothetical protein